MYANLPSAPVLLMDAAPLKVGAVLVFTHVAGVTKSKW
jgi:hypothetical protein